MPARFNSPRPQFLSETGEPLAGYKLFFYLTGTSTKHSTYSNMALSVANSNPVVLDQYGQPPADIFLQDVRYRVVLAVPDASDPPVGAEIVWDVSNVSGSDFGLFSIRKVGSGNPNGSVAGTAGSSGVLPTEYWDYTNNVLYICTTTGSTTTAAWTAINPAASAQAAVPSPQGRLTPTTSTPVISSNVVSATALYYTPYVGNQVPIYNGTTYAATSFSELTLTLASQHVANNIYDVFVFNDNGTLRLVTGPAWTTVTAGSGARGTGAGTTQLARVGGFLLNSVAMTGRNGLSTYSIAANRATFLGSILIDGSNGQITCHVGIGTSRRFAVWNYYNRAPIRLMVTDATASWNYDSSTVRQSNAATANTAAIFMGMDDEIAQIEFVQKSASRTNNSNNNAELQIGIGINSTTTVVSNSKRGTNGFGSNGSDQSFSSLSDMVAKHLLPPSLGRNDVNALEVCVTAGAGSNTFYGGADDMMLICDYRG